MENELRLVAEFLKGENGFKDMYFSAKSDEEEVVILGQGSLDNLVKPLLLLGHTHQVHAPPRRLWSTEPILATPLSRSRTQ